MKDVSKPPKAKQTNSPQGRAKRKKVLSICAMVAGLVLLVVGVVFLVLNILKMNQAADGEYLVTAKSWALEGQDGVVWDFTEIGKGTLTTNNHLNDYDFIWALEDGKIKIETSWLYNLENEYDYTLDQGSGVLTLTDGSGETYRFTKQ